MRGSGLKLLVAALALVSTARLAQAQAAGKRLLFVGICLVGIPILALMLIEGASSLVLFVSDLLGPVEGVITERAHTDYDTLLGWVGRPGFLDRDLYGPGIYLRTNTHGFRNNHEFTTRVPSGRLRLVCSGDSFTFGYGVDNDHTWCALLERKNPRLETVNMGQGGYGVDQAYLWYKRDGQSLDHDLQVFGVIEEDFKRMRIRKFFGYGKPVLVLEGDTLRVANVPVPKWSYRMPRFTSFVYQRQLDLAQLRVVQLKKRMQARFAPDLPPEAVDSATWQVADRVFADLSGTNRAKGTILVVLFLPTSRDLSDSTSDRWRGWLRLAAAQRGFFFVDLVEGFRRMPRDSARALFYNPPRRWGWKAAHYGQLGNQWVADQLYQQLLAWPTTAARLDTRFDHRAQVRR